MGLFSIILIITLIVLAIIALKFVAGMARTVTSLALFVLAALLLIGFLTNSDPLGVTSFVTSILP